MNDPDPATRSSRRTARRQHRSASLSRRKRWAFRSLALMLGLTPLVIAEAALRWSDWPRMSERQDPLIAFQNPMPLFQENTAEQRYEIAEARREFFRPDEFPLTKGENEFRIFCLGGSTVQGRPYQTETAFTTWLKLSLEACDPQTNWVVVNCGGVSYASYRLAPILEEVLEYEPDLIVLCSGHNEFLEDRTYAKLRDQPAWRKQTHRLASNLKLYQVMRWLWINRESGNATDRELLATEVQARLDYEGGLDLFVRDDEWREHVIGHYALNMRRMVQLAGAHQVPLILMNPVENLRDCGPFKSLPSHDTSSAQHRELLELLHQAQHATTPGSDRQFELLDAALSIDDRFAMTYYLLGRYFDSKSQFDDARECYERARDEDICPLRMVGVMHDHLRQIADDEPVRWIDLNRLFSERCPHGISDSTWLLDHVHPTIEGHRVIAAAILAEMVHLGYVQMEEGWEERRQASYDAHDMQLGFAYYEHGKQRLEGLRYWTEGRAHGALPASDKVPVLREE